MVPFVLINMLSGLSLIIGTNGMGGVFRRSAANMVGRSAGKTMSVSGCRKRTCTDCLMTNGKQKWLSWKKPLQKPVDPVTQAFLSSSVGCLVGARYAQAPPGAAGYSLPVAVVVLWVSAMICIVACLSQLMEERNSASSDAAGRLVYALHPVVVAVQRVQVMIRAANKILC